MKWVNDSNGFYQVGNLCGAHRSTIITLFNGAFDSSSAIFFIIKVLYEKGISLRKSFLFLAAYDIIHLLRTLFLLPKSHIPLSCRKSKSYNVELNSTQEDTSSESEPPTADAPLQTVHNISNDSFKSCILSWFFLWHLIWLSVMQLRHYLFIGTLNSMLNRLANQDPATVSRYTNAFAFTQLTGILCAPWNGLLIDRQKRKALNSGVTVKEADLRSSILSLFLTSLQCLLFSVCTTIPVLPLQYVTFVLQVLNRSFLYGGSAAFISIAFPAQHFGKLYGLVMSLSAVISLLQYPCLGLVKVFSGDPFYVNLILTIMTLLAFIHPLNVFLHCRRLATQRGHTESMLPALDN
ncbi:Solute carrier family 43 member 3 [Bagarius yarrelli]|uniref:Solute carrier family 43 member 3 n=1 Tax=Bagarius yarrelli TaxID=175774 RepID=A0A556TMG7_BAGYA|nr:Solute carrier family 43 member 3 [Bagarius yarrelli]